MFFYADRYIVQVLAFSIGPLCGFITTALFNPWKGVVFGVLGFFFLYFQPYFSDQCLRNTAEDLRLGPVICGEGKVSYLTRNEEIVGKLFLSKDNLVFLRNNQVEFTIPMEYIKDVDMVLEEQLEGLTSEERQQMRAKQSQAAAQAAALLVMATPFTAGVIKVWVNHDLVKNTFDFKVSNPYDWCRAIMETKAPQPRWRTIK